MSGARARHVSIENKIQREHREKYPAQGPAEQLSGRSFAHNTNPLRIVAGCRLDDLDEKRPHPCGLFLFHDQ
jgi:hypothetical protein